MKLTVPRILLGGAGISALLTILVLLGETTLFTHSIPRTGLIELDPGFDRAKRVALA